ncbi:MAG: hypothetical protein NVSMB64_00090 [Candidatus Velthaea sp.]
MSGTVFDRVTVRDALSYLGVSASSDRDLIRCPLPGHEDSSPSFKIVDGRGWTCFGCDRKGGIADLIVAFSHVSTHADAARWLESKLGLTTSPWADVATYTYRDSNGEITYEAVRQERVNAGSREKSFKMRVPRSEGGFNYRLNGRTRVLYRLPDVIAAKSDGRSVVVVEGEKDADRLVSLGFVATTSAGGAGWAWDDGFAAPLRGAKRIVVLADCDGPGRAAANARAELLSAICADVRVLDLAPDRNDGFDVSDWLDAGGDAVALRERMTAAPPFTVTTPLAAKAPAVIGLISLYDLLNTEIAATDWLVEGLIPMGGIALLSAKPKVGKSVLAQNLAIAVASGGEFLGRRCQQGRVLYLAMEERRETITARLRALGAKETMPIHLRVGRADADAMRWLQDAAAQLKPALVVVDTLVRMIRLEDIERYGATSNALEPLLALSREFGIAQLWLHHNNKSGDTTNSVSGSNAIVAAVDTTLIMKRSEDGTRGLFSEQRVGEDMEETVLRMDPDTFEITSAGSRAVAEQRAAELRILELLREPITREDIAKLPGCRLYVGRQAAGALISDGSIVPVSGTGLKGDPRLYGTRPTRDFSDEESLNKRIASSPGPVKGPDEQTKQLFLRPDLVDEAGRAGRSGRAERSGRTK